MEKINFEDIRKGDRIMVRVSGDHYTTEHTFTAHAGPRGSVWWNEDRSAMAFEGGNRDIYLLDRPEPQPTFKVGDKITGSQVKDLPDGAVFDLGGPRYKIGDWVYTMDGKRYATSVYRGEWAASTIVFLP